MNETRLLTRIVINPAVMAGKPVIRGTRLTVEYILGLLAQGMSVEDILAEYEGLTAEDIQACLVFAKASPADTTYRPLESGAT